MVQILKKTSQCLLKWTMLIPRDVFVMLDMNRKV